MKINNLIQGYEPVSVIVCVKNGADFLKTNIPLILQQIYPNFELIIAVDTDSSDNSFDLASEISQHNKNVKILSCSNTSGGKKKLLDLAIKTAKYDWILCTDIDCFPISNQWIKKIMENAASNTIVLGYSPMLKKQGILNLFSRFENQINTMLSFSFAKLGLPYTAVGRNLLYHRSIYDFQAINFSIPYGDDDLLINKKANVSNTTVCLDPASFVYTYSCQSFADFFQQKRRHISASHWYNPLSKIFLFPFYAGLFFFYFLFIFCLFINPVSALTVFCLRLCIVWFIFYNKSKLLHDNSTAVFFPFLECIFVIHLIVQAPFLLFPKKNW